jgi:alkylation response protein AidB-like acyl-CoA dehydrogenase
MAMITTATEDGDSYILDGQKIWITNGPIADVVTVYAKTDAGEGAASITAFLVPTDTPGFHVGEPIEKLGLNTCPFCQLEFRECRVPKENIVGKVGSGFFILEHVMNYEILCIFTMMAGEMQERMERCIKWAKTRQAFGQPIGSNQYVAGKIVDMKIGLENSRKHLYDTARRFARGRSVTTEISMAKLITSEANVASALSAIQIFGARGYSREYGLEKALRDSVGAPIYSGTNETQRVRIASMLGL